MIPAAFDYVRASMAADAIRLLSENPDGAKLLAGGHSLIPALKLRLASPSLLIDIRGIDDLKGIDIADGVRIGALCTHGQIYASQELHRIFPIFRQAADLIADPQVRNRGTIGGSLANADPAADWPAVVIAMNAEIEVLGPRERRRIPAREFFLDIMTTALGTNEILTAIHIPPPGGEVRARYRKISHPASGYAVVGVAARVRIQDGQITSASIGITGATGKAFEAAEAGSHLAGKTPTAQLIEHAASIAADRSDYLADSYAPAAYRKQLVKVETRRVLAELLL
jgi:aerobic carbon-monoxide dehydrogenase medium subunit